MSQFFTRSAFLCLVFLTLCARAATADDVRAFGEYMKLAEAFGFSGSVLVARGDSIVLAAGYGYADQNTDIKNTQETAFDIGSLTKQFTAAAIMRLQMQAKLSTNDELGKFFPAAPADKLHVTLHQLLTHTSGLPVYTPGGDFDILPERDGIDWILRSKLEFAPGSNFRYSNTDYTLLAAVVEKASGKSYEQFLADEFFTTLGMAHTGDALPQWAEHQIAYGYAQREPFSIAPFIKFMPYYAGLFGNGGMVSTTKDMYRWIRVLQQHTAISGDSLAEMLRPDHSEDYGYGWEVRRKDGAVMYQHGGLGNFGYNSLVQWDADGNIVIVLCNVDQLPTGTIMRDSVSGVLWDAVRGVRTLRSTRADFVQPAPVRESIRPGTFRLPSGGRLVVSAQGGAIFLSPHGQDAVDLIAGTNGSDRARLHNESILTAKLLSDGQSGSCATAARIAPGPAGETLCHALAQRLQELIARTGVRALQFEVVGSVPAWFDPDGTDATFVATNAASFPIFRLHWTNGRIDAFGGKAIPSPAMIELKLTRDGSYIGFHPGLDATVAIRVMNRGPARRISIASASGSAIATAL